jgi:hypothetical protein
VGRATFTIDPSMVASSTLVATATMTCHLREWSTVPASAVDLTVEG